MERNNISMNISTKEGMAAAVAWQRNHLNTIREGGMWVIPRSGTVLKVSHAKKTLSLVANLLPELPDLRAVTEAMGWTLVDETCSNN